MKAFQNVKQALNMSAIWLLHHQQIGERQLISSKKRQVFGTNRQALLPARHGLDEYTYGLMQPGFASCSKDVSSEV